jgi:hydrogenase expression/formation protein HypC
MTSKKARHDRVTRNTPAPAGRHRSQEDGRAIITLEVSLMCLGIPGRIVTVSGKQAIVDCWGTRRSIDLRLLAAAPVPGDLVLDHAGFALTRVPDNQVEDTLAMYEMLLAETEEDPIMRDLFGEVHFQHDEAWDDEWI